MDIIFILLIICTVGWIGWGIYLPFSARHYKVITDGKEIRIRFPHGTIGCVNYESVEKAEEQIIRYIQEHLKAEADKKKNWKVIK